MSRTLLYTLTLTGALLSAQDITGGLSTGLSAPEGDLKDKSGFGTNQLLGVHVGGHLDFNLTSHHQVRGHLTFQDFPGSNWGFSGPKNNFKAIQVGADWVYHFENPHHGWYTIAGGSINSLKDDYSRPGYSASASQSGKLGVRGGGGYTFTPSFSLEGTLNQVFVEAGGSNGFGFATATWVQASAVFRFGR